MSEDEIEITIWRNMIIIGDLGHNLRVTRNNSLGELDDFVRLALAKDLC
jgi:hypothetical protein